MIGYKNAVDIDTDANTLSYSYDGFDRVLSVTDKAGNVQQASYKSLSDEYSFVPSGSTTPENHVTVNYDIYGRTISESVYPDGIDNPALTTSYSYDLYGNVLSTTDANGKETSYEYDDISNPIKLNYADGSVVTNEYTKWGNVRKTTRNDGREVYSISSTFNDAGAALTHRQTGDKINTRAWNYEYDSNGRLSLESDPNGNVNQYQYDENGSVISIKTGSNEQQYGYTHFGTADYTGQFTNGVKTGSRYNVYTNHNLSKSVAHVDETTISYAYDELNNLKRISPSGYVGVDYTRDSLERITGVTSGEMQFTYEYYADGMVKKLSYPTSDICVEYTYDNTNRLKTLAVKSATAELRSYSYTYDNVGNILSVSGSENITYTYDDLYRLKSYTQDGVTTTYEYDSRNNLKSEARPGYIKIYE